MKKLAVITFIMLSVASINAQNSSSISRSSNSNSHTSISAKSTNNQYSYTASFDAEKTNLVKTTIVNVLGKCTDETNGYAYWENHNYTVELKKGKVKIEMNKENLIKVTKLKIEDLGDQISEVLGSPKTPKTPEPPKAD